MDYELHRDLYGRHQAKFSMGHEALGLWLSEELGSDQQLLNTLLEKIGQLQHHLCWEHHHAGREFTLTMNPEGIEVRATLLDAMDDEAADDLNHYDQESEASCGLDDFRQLLEAWRDYCVPGHTP
jgi:uncharacterized protein YacL (UPF0231 family)